jgi:hypothetical protein
MILAVTTAWSSCKDELHDKHSCHSLLVPCSLHRQHGTPLMACCLHEDPLLILHVSVGKLYSCCICTPKLVCPGCDFSGQDLSGKVFSGVMLQGANLANAKVVGSQFARADAKSAILTNVDFTDTNCYGR